MSVYSTHPKNKLELDKQLDLLGDILEEHIETAMNFQDADKRALNVAKTSLQTGFMWFKKGLKNDTVF